MDVELQGVSRQEIQCLDAEKHVLGSMIRFPDCIESVIKHVDSSDFFEPNHQRLFTWLVGMDSEGTPIDIVTLGEDLSRHEALAGIGAPLIADLYETVITAAGVERHAQIVAETRKRRDMKYRLQALFADAVNGKPFETLAEQIHRLSESVTERRQTSEFRLMDSAEFAGGAYYNEFLVDGVLVRGQPCIIAGPKKALKTSICVDLAVSLASGTPVLDKFVVPQSRRVAVFSAESGAATLQESASRVCASRGIDLADLGENLTWCFQVPSLDNYRHLSELHRAIKSRKIDVLILDPAYLMIGNVDPKNLFDVGKRLLALSRLAQKTGCTFIVVHHAKKTVENPNAAPQLEDIAFSGFQEWARQWILLSRRRKYDPDANHGYHELWFMFGGSAGHSGLWGLDVDEGQFPNRTWTPSFTRPSEFCREEAKLQHDEKVAQKEAQQRATVERRQEKIIASLQHYPAGTTRRELQDASGLSGSSFTPALNELVADGRIQRFRGVHKNKTVDMYRLPVTLSQAPAESPTPMEAKSDNSDNLGLSA